MTQGFKIGGRDVEIRNGSVHGQGVYCATGSSTPLSYGGGQVVILAEALPGHRGATEGDRTADSWTPTSCPDWIIFRSSSQLLPRYVVYIEDAEP
mmetsp:Transcript_15238/g.28994  ORF Transcript_15238/g.28994 Transcript_15238/m.28994 type:complete len:95 (-) Transcript_15238:145-429(-)